MVPKQKSCSSVEVGKREQWEFPASHMPGELTVLDWSRASSWAGPASALAPASCCSHSSAFTHLHHSDISLFWMEHLRKDGCFIMDGRQKNVAQMSMAKHPVDLWKQRSAAPKGQLEVYNTKKEDVAELMDSYFNICTVVGLRLLYAK